MTVTFLARIPCVLCGYQHTFVQVSTVRVNKNSLVTRGGLATVGARTCPECGSENVGGAIRRMRLLPDDAARVQAYRARKWPELRKGR